MAYTTIDKPASYFNTKLYTGNGSATQAITGVGFKPDLVWVKNRTAAVSHCWVDGVRAAPNQLGSDLTDAENTSGNAYGVYGGVSALGTDGFTVSLGSDPTYQATNKSAQNYVAWNWLGANTTVSNTSGTITSTVSANTTAGFSIVSYTGTGSNATVGHSLGTTPSMIIIKNRDAVTNWIVGHKSLGLNNGVILLNSTSASTTDSTVWNNTSPTSSVFSVGANGGSYGTTTTSNKFIAYCFAEVKGYSKFGSYTGNGSTDGTFVYTGFKPAWLMIKGSSVTGSSWNIWDNKRTPINAMFSVLSAESSNTEYTDSAFRSIDFTSQGFKIRVSAADLNTSSASYIYMAFAENPFVSSSGIPTTAR